MRACAFVCVVLLLLRVQVSVPSLTEVQELLDGERRRGKAGIVLDLFGDGAPQERPAQPHGEDGAPRDHRRFGRKTGRATVWRVRRRLTHTARGGEGEEGRHSPSLASVTQRPNGSLHGRPCALGRRWRYRRLLLFRATGLPHLRRPGSFPPP